MKKITFLIPIILLAVLIGISFAGNNFSSEPRTVSISGVVIDKDSQETLSGALIKLEGTDIEVYSDLDGKFTINDIVPDRYKVNCSMISYSDTASEIAIESGSDNLKIELSNVVTE